MLICGPTAPEPQPSTDPAAPATVNNVGITNGATARRGVPLSDAAIPFPVVRASKDLTLSQVNDILEPMATEVFFSKARKEFIARSLMDVFKLLFVAAVVGGFFVSYPINLRIAGGTILAMMFVTSVLIFPRKEV
jgi:hypothetical protein